VVARVVEPELDFASAPRGPVRADRSRPPASTETLPGWGSATRGLRPPEALVVWVEAVEDEEGLIAADPFKFFTTPHYDGQPIVLAGAPFPQKAGFEGAPGKADDAVAQRTLGGFGVINVGADDEAGQLRKRVWPSGQPDEDEQGRCGLAGRLGVQGLREGVDLLGVVGGPPVLVGQLSLRVVQRLPLHQPEQLGMLAVEVEDAPHVLGRVVGRQAQGGYMLVHGGADDCFEKLLLAPEVPVDALFVYAGGRGDAVDTGPF